MKLVSCIEDFGKWTVKRNFIKSWIINEDLVAVLLRPESVLLDKCYGVGFTILQHAKSIMSKYYYNVLVKYFTREKIRLLMTDTDSILCKVSTKCLKQNWLDLAPFMDFSNHPVWSDLRDTSKANWPFLLKDETENQASILSFIGLRPKLYTMKLKPLPNHPTLKQDEETEVKKAKGIAKQSIKHDMAFSEYESCLKNGRSISKTFFTIRSKNHEVFTMRQSKIALNALCSKRWVKDCGRCSLTLNHYRIKTEGSQCRTCPPTCSLSNV